MLKVFPGVKPYRFITYLYDSLDLTKLIGFQVNPDICDVLDLSRTSYVIKVCWACSCLMLTPRSETY